MTHGYMSKQIPEDRIVTGLTTKSDKIRALFRAGYSRSEISKYLGIRYQHARNVLVAAGFMESRLRSPLPEEPVAAEGHPAAPPAQVRSVVGPGGRMVIPAAYRDALGIAEGDAVFMRLDGEELRLVSDETEVLRVRELVAGYVPEGVSLVEELLRERRREVDADGDR